MAFVALVINPLIVFFMIRKNPYPLVFNASVLQGKCLPFTALAAIPVNMLSGEELAESDTHSVSIPLGQIRQARRRDDQYFDASCRQYLAHSG